MVRIILLIVVSSVLFGSPASTGDLAKIKKGAAQTAGTTAELRTTLRGHTVGVGTLAFSPDGKSLASGGGNLIGKAKSELKLWDLQAGKESADLKGHSGVIFAVAFSPDGKTLASASGTALSAAVLDDTVRLWDVKALKQKGVLKGSDGTVAAVVFSPNNKLVIAGCWDRAVRIWDAATGKAQGGFPNLEVQTLALSPDGKTLAVGSLKGMLHLFDMTTGKPGPALKGFTGAVQSLAFSKDGKLLAAAGGATDEDSYRRHVRVWELKTRKDKLDVTGKDGTAKAVAFLPDGKTAVYAHEVRDKEGVTVGSDVRLVDLTSGKERAVFRTHYLLSLAISRDGTTIATGGLDQSIKLWDVTEKEKVKSKKYQYDFCLFTFTFLLAWVAPCHHHIRR
jgi:WD40 repeat protein